MSEIRPKLGHTDVVQAHGRLCGGPRGHMGAYVVDHARPTFFLTLSEVKPSYDQVGPSVALSVGRSVCHNFLGIKNFPMIQYVRRPVKIF